jgi:hypothetical protein
VNQSTIRLLRVVFASAVIALWPVAAGAQTPAPDPLVGTWTVTVMPRSGPTFPAISTFHSDGTYVHVDGNRFIAMGQWVRVSNLKYTNNFQVLNFDQSGIFSGITTVHVDLTIDATLGAFTGTYEFQTVDSDGNVTASGGGTREGTRFTQ